MNKLFSLVIVLLATSAFGNDSLQSIGDVVEHMGYVTLCGLNYTILVEEKNPTPTTMRLTFETKNPLPTGFNADDTCVCIKRYMADAVGTDPTTNAQCISTPTSFKIVYQGAYNPEGEQLPPLKKLANAISAYESPDLGGWTCSQKVTESESGWVYIKVKTLYNGPKCGSQYTNICDDITGYLIQGNFLAKSKRKCTRCGDYVVVDLWADE